MKQCSRCGNKYPIEDFNRDSGFVDGRKRICRHCTRWHIIWNKYRIREDQYINLLEQQEGRCAICGLQAAENVPLRVDHNHTTGAIRGLLCHNCNTGLGHFRDSLQTLHKAIEYLIRNHSDVTGDDRSCQT